MYPLRNFLLCIFLLLLLSCNKNLTDDEKKELWSKAQTTGEIYNRSGSKLPNSTDFQKQRAMQDAKTRLTTGEWELMDATVTKVGVKYVSGDITLSAGMSSGEGKDSDTMGTKGTTVDSKDVTEAGISYAVASGVTANIGWKDIQAKDEGSTDNTGGSSWYIGASMSF